MAAFLLIAYLLNVNTVRVKTAQKIWRPTKAEVQEGFISRVTTCAEIKDTINGRQRKLNELHVSVQPYVLIVGKDLNDVTGYYVIVDDVMYSVSNIMSAVDCCFKVIWALNASYSVESHDVWAFLQQSCYQLSSKYDKQSTALNTLLNDIGLP